MREAAFVIGLALVISAALQPMIEALQRRVPRWLAVSAVYLGASAMIAAAVLLAMATVPSQHGVDPLQRAFAAAQARWPRQLRELEGSVSVASLALAASTRVFRGVVVVVLALVLSLGWTVSAAAAERLILSLLPAQRRGTVIGTWRAVTRAAGERARADVVQSLLALLLLALFFGILGVPYALVVALGVAVLRVVPVVGVMTGVLAALLAGLVVGVPQGLTAAVVTALLLAALEAQVEHRMVGNPPSRVVVGVSLLLTFDIAGPLGLLAAPVVAAVLGALVARWVAARRVPPEPLSMSRLFERATILHHALDKAPEVSPEVISLVERLDALIETLASSSQQITPQPRR
jgi:predicted PurR-regulated permease PerM